ncbi:hypothetical protein TcasGA2_TC032918 [Tribolium castaneum]|uniref:Uncharacterized protein n=1 Tax=Tribolium castaneum TaxID=7070 RepID=A0A139WK64_TRICA|nr:hypothetical protein TcasGA2_TC032918 [Tribolium castaneum]
MKFFATALFFFLLVAASFAIPAGLFELEPEEDGFSPRQRQYLPPYCGWRGESCH